MWGWIMWCWLMMMLLLVLLLYVVFVEWCVLFVGNSLIYFNNLLVVFVLLVLLGEVVVVDVFVWFGVCLLDDLDDLMLVCLLVCGCYIDVVF